MLASSRDNHRTGYVVSGQRQNDAQRRQEIPDPSHGPDPEDAADATGQAEKRTHDYARHGTTTLFAALEIATAEVTGLCKPRHRHQEFLVFLRHLAQAIPTSRCI
jgi:hypothetical protein